MSTKRVRIVTPDAKFLVEVPQRMTTPDNRPELEQYLIKFLPVNKLLAYHVNHMPYVSKADKGPLEMYHVSVPEIEVNNKAVTTRLTAIISTNTPLTVKAVESLPDERACSCCGGTIMGTLTLDSNGSKSIFTPSNGAQRIKRKGPNRYLCVDCSVSHHKPSEVPEVPEVTKVSKSAVEPARYVGLRRYDLQLSSC